MQHFLFVPTESGKTEMAALTATRTVDAVEEAGQCEFGGRTGYLFDGDVFVQEVRTAAGVTLDDPLGDAIRDRDQIDPDPFAALRPG
jgi:hypothetical protein